MCTVPIGAWGNGLVVRVLDSLCKAPDSEPLVGSKMDSSFHPAMVGQMNAANPWRLTLTKKLVRFY